MDKFPYLLLILTAAGLYFVLFIYAQRREKNYINIETYDVIISLPTLFLFPFASILFGGISHTFYSYFYIYVCLVASRASFIFAFYNIRIRCPNPPFPLSPRNLDLIVVLATLMSVALMWVAVSNAGVPGGALAIIFEPRLLYLATRTSAGIYLFVSAFLSFLAIIYASFSIQRIVAKIFVISVNIFLLYLHGSKGQLLSIVFVFVYYQVYVRHVKIRLSRFALIAIFIGLTAYGSFAFLQRNINIHDSIIDQMTHYSDYVPNSASLIDSTLPLQYGKLTLENNIVGLIPRVLWSAKPVDFGSLYLAKVFFPETFELNSGAPAFLFGAALADFGVFTIFYLIVVNLAIGAVGRIFWERCKQFRSPLDFIILINFAGIDFFPTGLGWHFPELFVVTLFLGVLMRLKLSGFHRLITS